jgi:hypothetical protein
VDSYANFFDGPQLPVLDQEPLLNHKSELYDDSTHVRVRLLSSKPLPIKFEDFQPTVVEQDRSSVYLRSATKGVESFKSKVNQMLKDNPETGPHEGKGVIIMHVHGGGFVAMSSSSH